MILIVRQVSSWHSYNPMFVRYVLCQGDGSKIHLPGNSFKSLLYYKGKLSRKISTFIATSHFSLVIFNSLDYSVFCASKCPPCFFILSTGLIICTTAHIPRILFPKLKVKLCCIFLQERSGLVLVWLPVQQSALLVNIASGIYAFWHFNGFSTFLLSSILAWR